MYINPSFEFPDITSDERMAFNFFRTQVTSQLTGYFDGWFWKTAVLQASHHEPAIKHAILALGSLVQRMQLKSRLTSSSEPNEGIFALQHYNRAIKELKISSRRRSLCIDVCLITCLLFSAFEVCKHSLIRLRCGAKEKNVANPSTSWLCTFAYQQWGQDPF